MQAAPTQPESKAVVPPAAVMAAGMVPRRARLKEVWVGVETIQEVAALVVPVKNGLATKLTCACTRDAKSKQSHTNAWRIMACMLGVETCLKAVSFLLASGKDDGKDS
jgi:hypothetical protein